MDRREFDPAEAVVLVMLGCCDLPARITANTNVVNAGDAASAEIMGPP
jgi:hypothetical protein